jgi:hypothetical protein
MTNRIPANRAGGKEATPIRMARYVVPQKRHTAAQAVYAFMASFLFIKQIPFAERLNESARDDFIAVS